MNILTFTSLYPNAVRPGFAVFVENRLRHLVAGGEVSAHVVAPVPWFPLRAGPFGDYAAFARVPRHETRYGIAIDHPRYPVIPKIGMNVAPALMAAAVKGPISRLADRGISFDLIDAHYFYPDGVAAQRLGRVFGKPVVITARGTDVNVIAEYPGPRAKILAAASAAAAVVCVSDALRLRLRDLGVAPEKLHTLRNGVDLEAFVPADRAAARRALGLGDGKVIAAVGNLVPGKRQGLIVDALPRLPGALLLIAGDGPDESALRQAAERAGVADRVTFLGRVDHAKLAQVFSAADVSVLASAREGWPNVLLESMACGTPVVATRVGGVPEIVQAPEAGRIVDEATADSIATSIGEILREPPPRAATRAYAEKFSWDATTRGQIALFREILGRA